MEFLTILLSAVLGLVAPAGLVADRVVESAIRDRLESADQLAVRIDNAPSYQILQGRVQRVRIAGRGLYLTPDARIDLLELETDPISVVPSSLSNGPPQLRQPLQMAARLVLQPDDINRLLQSETISQRLQDLSIGLLGGAGEGQIRSYDFVDPQIEFLGQNRLLFQVVLQEQDTSSQLQISLQTGLEVVAGRQLRLIDPEIIANGAAVPAELVNLFTDGVNQQLDLSRLEDSGITARILQLEIDHYGLQMAAFVRLSPDAFSSDLAADPGT